MTFYNEEQRDKILNKIAEEVAITPNGNMRFKTHFENEEGSMIGWYVID